MKDKYRIVKRTGVQSNDIEYCIERKRIFFGRAFWFKLDLFGYGLAVGYWHTSYDTIKHNYISLTEKTKYEIIKPTINEKQ